MNPRSTGISGGALVCVLACTSLCFACGEKKPTTAPDGGGGPPPAAAPADFAAQVALGQELYGANCASCHGAGGEGGSGPRVVGMADGALPLDPPAGAKLRTGKFTTVADVANFVVATMPMGRGGSLTTDQYLAILAFDLKANGVDPGPDALTLEKAAALTIPR